MIEVKARNAQHITLYQSPQPPVWNLVDHLRFRGKKVSPFPSQLVVLWAPFEVISDAESSLFRSITLSSLFWTVLRRWENTMISSCLHEDLKMSCWGVNVHICAYFWHRSGTFGQKSRIDWSQDLCTGTSWSWLSKARCDWNQETSIRSIWLLLTTASWIEKNANNRLSPLGTIRYGVEKDTIRWLSSGRSFLLWGSLLLALPVHLNPSFHYLGQETQQSSFSYYQPLPLLIFPLLLPSHKLFYSLAQHLTFFLLF